MSAEFSGVLLATSLSIKRQRLSSAWKFARRIRVGRSSVHAIALRESLCPPEQCARLCDIPFGEGQLAILGPIKRAVRAPRCPPFKDMGRHVPLIAPDRSFDKCLLDDISLWLTATEAVHDLSDRKKEINHILVALVAKSDERLAQRNSYISSN